MRKKKKNINGMDKTEVFERIGDYLRKQRLHARVSQKVISEKAGLTTPQYISNIERGISPPSIDILKIMKKTYNMDPKDFSYVISRAHYDFYLKELQD